MMTRERDIVNDFIQRRLPLDKSATYVVALSGGPDSVALALLMTELGFHIHVAHCNFSLRGEESNSDEEFVKSFARSHSLPLHLAHFDTREYARLHHLSIETAARQLRYSWLEALLSDIGAAAILVGHHRDDNAETVLMNLVRGTGIRGLCGIRPVRGKVIRPLLCLSRRDILSYLEQRGERYVTDSSNLESVATRNKFRLEIIPKLLEINNGAVENINAASVRLSDAFAIVDSVVGDALKNSIRQRVNHVGLLPAVQVEADKSAILRFPSPRYLLNELCGSYGFLPSQTGDILRAMSSSQPGTLFRSASHCLVVDRDTIVIEPCEHAGISMSMPEEGSYVSGNIRFRIEESAAVSVSYGDSMASVDADKVAFPLLLRLVGRGDRFTPLGMRGSKLLSDFLTDCRLNLLEKRRQLVVEDARGNIVWVVGRRINDRCKITGKTRLVLLLSYEELK